MLNKKTFFKRTALSAAIIATLGLTACGGGGGSSSSDDGTTSFSASSSGTAAKGIISGGIVTATEVSTGNEVGTALTDIDGKYQLTIGSNYQGGPIQLTITADADTQMKCDATEGCGTRPADDGITDTDAVVDFGEWYKPGAGGVQMRALIPAASNGATISASITPFTEMAAARAGAAPTADSIAAANSEVTSLLGVNILNTPPVDITSLPAGASATEIAYAALASAAANLAGTDSETGLLDVQAGIDALASALSEDGIIANDDDTDESVISLQDILAEAAATLNKVDADDTSGILDELQDDIQQAGEDGLVNPDPVDTATLSAVDKAKALVADFRTYATELDTTLSNPEFGGEFAQQIELASNFIGTGKPGIDPVAALSYVSEDVQDLAEYILWNYEDTSDSGTLEFPLTEDNADLLATPFSSGSMDYTIEINPETGAYEITADFTNAVVESYTVNLSFVYSGVYQESSEDNYNQETKTTTGSYDEVDNMNNTISGSMVSEFSNLNITSGEVLQSSESESYSYNEAQESGTYSSVMVNQLSLDATLAVLNEGSETPITFSGELNADVMSKENEEYSYNWSTDEYSQNEQSVSYIKAFDMNGSVAYGSEEVGLDVSVAMPNADDFYAMDLGSIEETTEQWLQMNAGIGLSVDTLNLSDVDLNVSATRTAFDAAEAEIRLSHADRSILVSFATQLVADGMPTSLGDAMNLTVGEASGDIQVTDANGTTMTLTPPTPETEGVIGEVTVDGIAVATIEQTEDGLIKTSYADGTFEIF